MKGSTDDTHRGRGNMKNKYMIFPLVMSSVAFTCFAFLAQLFLSGVHPMWAETLVLLIPSLVLGVFAILSAKGLLGRAASITLTCVFSALFVAAGFFYTCFLFFASFDADCTTDPADYAAGLRQIYANEYVREYFPRSIPENATDVTFDYHPALFQGGEEFTLSYRTTDSEIEAWEERLQDAEWIGTDEAWSDEYNMYEDNGSSPGTTRYQLYWDGGYNHGEMVYVLIDRTTNTMTFSYSHY